MSVFILICLFIRYIKIQINYNHYVTIRYGWFMLTISKSSCSFFRFIVANIVF